MGRIKEIAKGARSLIGSMGVTLKHLKDEPVTVEYPAERAPISPLQRNAIRLIEKEETPGSHNCIACLQCEKICPSNCISITGYRPEGLAMKRPETFDLNFALCSECGLCLDVCPTATLGYTKVYDKAGYTRADFFHDLLEEYRETEEQVVEHLREADRRKKAEREAKRKAEAEAKAKEAGDAQ
ncbi:MAG: 4Fe-4S binding protein [Candidatus Sumerlaeia bacterium]|nr:4Fe-4S binding protein [Candidatus Sumerlaeia bacterium]